MQNRYDDCSARVLLSSVGCAHSFPRFTLFVLLLILIERNGLLLSIYYFRSITFGLLPARVRSSHSKIGSRHNGDTVPLGGWTGWCAWRIVISQAAEHVTSLAVSCSYSNPLLILANVSGSLLAEEGRNGRVTKCGGKGDGRPRARRATSTQRRGYSHSYCRLMDSHTYATSSDRAHFDPSGKRA